MDSLLSGLFSALLAQQLRTPGKEDVRVALQAVGAGLGVEAFLPALQAVESTFGDIFDEELHTRSSSDNAGDYGDASNAEDQVMDIDLDLSLGFSGLATPVSDTVAVLEAIWVCMSGDNNSNSATKQSHLLCLRGMLASLFHTLKRVSHVKLKAVLAADYCRSVLLDLLQICLAWGGEEMLLFSAPASTATVSTATPKKRGSRSGSVDSLSSIGSTSSQRTSSGTPCASNTYYEASSVYADIDLVLTCVGAGRTSHTRASALKLLQAMLGLKLPSSSGGSANSAVSHCVESLGRFLADATLSSGLAMSNAASTAVTMGISNNLNTRSKEQQLALKGQDISGEKLEENSSLGTILQALVDLTASSSSDVRASPQSVLQPLCAYFARISASRRAHLIGLALTAFNSAGRASHGRDSTSPSQPALPAAVAVLLTHCLLSFQSERANSGGGIVKPRIIVKDTGDGTDERDSAPSFVLLSRAAQHKASRIALGSTSEDIYRLAQDVTLQQTADVQISSLVEIMRCAKGFVDILESGSELDNMDADGTVDVMQLHMYRARLAHGSVNTESSQAVAANVTNMPKRRGRHRNYASKAKNAVDAIASIEEGEDVLRSRGAAATMALLLLEYVYDIVESRAFHRAFVTYVDKEQKENASLGKVGVQSRIQAVLLELFDNILQLIATASQAASNSSSLEKDRNLAIVTENTETLLSLQAFGGTVEQWCLDVLRSLQRLLDPASFVSILHELIGHDMAAVRKAALGILSLRLERLTNAPNSVKGNTSVAAAHAEEMLLLLEMSGQLQSTIVDVLGYKVPDKTDEDCICIKILDPAAGMDSSDRESCIELAQSALMCLDVLARGLGGESAWGRNLMGALSLCVIWIGVLEGNRIMNLK